MDLWFGSNRILSEQIQLDHAVLLFLTGANGSMPISSSQSLIRAGYEGFPNRRCSMSMPMPSADQERALWCYRARYLEGCDHACR